MALDSYDRTAALNAVIEAWTRKGSNPFIEHVGIAAGTTKTFTCTSAWSALAVFVGGGADRLGVAVFNALPTLILYRSLATMSHITVTGTPASFTITNSLDRGQDIYIVSLAGTFEEV